MPGVNNKHCKSPKKKRKCCPIIPIPNLTGAGFTGIFGGSFSTLTITSGTPVPVPFGSQPSLFTTPVVTPGTNGLTINTLFNPFGLSGLSGFSSGLSGFPFTGLGGCGTSLKLKDGLQFDITTVTPTPSFTLAVYLGTTPITTPRAPTTVVVVSATTTRIIFAQEAVTPVTGVANGTLTLQLTNSSGATITTIANSVAADLGVLVYQLTKSRSKHGSGF